MLYIMSYVIISRISYYIEVSRGFGKQFYYMPPFDCTEIATNRNTERMHYFLSGVFMPLYYIDHNYISGITQGGVPLMEPSCYPELFGTGGAYVQQPPCEVVQPVSSDTKMLISLEPTRSISSDLKSPDTDLDFGEKSEDEALDKSEPSR